MGMGNLPSTRRNSGQEPAFSSSRTAFFMARRDAWRMLILSMVVCETTPTPIRASMACKLANSCSRDFAESFLESKKRVCWQVAGRMTAAATTGPASGPRPTSSRPATTEYPCCRRFLSIVKLSPDGGLNSACGSCLSHKATLANTCSLATSFTKIEETRTTNTTTADNLDFFDTWVV